MNLMSRWNAGGIVWRQRPKVWRERGKITTARTKMSGKEGDFFFFNVFVAVALELLVMMSI